MTYKFDIEISIRNLLTEKRKENVQNKILIHYNRSFKCIEINNCIEILLVQGCYKKNDGKKTLKKRGCVKNAQKKLKKAYVQNSHIGLKYSFFTYKIEDLR